MTKIIVIALLILHLTTGLSEERKTNNKRMVIDEGMFNYAHEDGCLLLTLKHEKSITFEDVPAKTFRGIGIDTITDLTEAYKYLDKNHGGLIRC